MAQLHLALGYRRTDRSETPHVVYCGNDADACGRAIDGALTGGVFARVERYRPNSPIVKHADVPSDTPPIPQPETVEAPKAPKKRKKSKASKAPESGDGGEASDSDSD